MKDAESAPFIAEGMSASSKTTIGAWSVINYYNMVCNPVRDYLAAKLSSKSRQVSANDAFYCVSCICTCLDMCCLGS